MLCSILPQFLQYSSIYHRKYCFILRENATYTAHMVLCLSNMQMRSATNLIKTYYAFFKYVFEDNWIYNQINLKGSDIYLIYT